MASFMTPPTTAKTQLNGSDIVIGTDRAQAQSLSVIGLQAPRAADRLGALAIG